MPEPGRLDRLLGIHAELHEVEENLDVTLRLHVAAHHAVREPRLSLPGDERGNDGVERPLVRRQPVGMAFGQHESGAPVLEHDAGARDDDARSEIAVDRVDEGHHVAVGVGHGQVDGLARGGDIARAGRSAALRGSIRAARLARYPLSSRAAGLTVM